MQHTLLNDVFSISDQCEYNISSSIVLSVDFAQNGDLHITYRCLLFFFDDIKTVVNYSDEHIRLHTKFSSIHYYPSLLLYQCD